MFERYSDRNPNIGLTNSERELVATGKSEVCARQWTYAADAVARLEGAHAVADVYGVTAAGVEGCALRVVVTSQPHGTGKVHHRSACKEKPTRDACLVVIHPSIPLSVSLGLLGGAKSMA